MSVVGGLNCAQDIFGILQMCIKGPALASGIFGHPRICKGPCSALINIQGSQHSWIPGKFLEFLSNSRIPRNFLEFLKDS